MFHPEFQEDLRHWVEIDRKVALRARDLIEAILRDPLGGIGKPEPLKYLAPETWSRRLTAEHRLVYLIEHERIEFLQARMGAGGRHRGGNTGMSPHTGG